MERIAKVRATGARFVVQQIDFRAERVHVWGELISFRETRPGSGKFSCRFESAQSFALSDVEIADVVLNEKTVRALLEQTKAARRAAGHVLVGNMDYGTPEQIEMRREFEETVNRAFAKCYSR